MLDYSSLIGIPYKQGGRDIKTGVDCLGLCIEIFKRKGIIDFPDFSAPDKREEIHKLIMEGTELFEEIDKPEEGCVVALMVRPPYVTHMGVIINEKEFIHISETCRSLLVK